MVQQISDDEVVGRVRSGDTESYGVLAIRYHGPLCRLARRMLRSEADAEDAVQGAHLLALTHLDQYSGESNYFRWMYSIVVNEARTQMRKGRRKAEIGESYKHAPMSPVRNPEQQAVDREIKGILESAVETLPQAYIPVVRCREMEELTTAQTSERLGLSDACVKTRLFRAKNVLRTRLSEVLKEADLERPAPESSSGARNW